jgi:RimJ/RimL family protein N-acetyltransferase
MTRAARRLIDALPLCTARLTLRALDERYADALAAMLADPVVMRFFPHPMTRAEADAWLHLNLDRYRQHGTGMFAVCRGDDWIGDCGIIRRDLDATHVFELGYHFRRDVWGRGYATEAARACVDLAFEVLDADAVPVLVALIRPGNRPSQRVARRLAFHVEGAVLHAGECHERWVVTRARHAADDRGHAP